MIGMNAGDALGHMEDMAMIGSAYRNAEEISLQRSASSETDRQASTMRTMEAVATAVALKERGNTINRLKGQLSDVQHNRNFAAILSIAASNTLDQVIQDFARAIGVSEDEMRKRYNTVRTANFNRQANEGIKKGWFNHDPREDLSDAQKKWFVAGLDADNGY